MGTLAAPGYGNSTACTLPDFCTVTRAWQRQGWGERPLDTARPPVTYTREHVPLGVHVQHVHTRPHTMQHKHPVTSNDACVLSTAKRNASGTRVCYHQPTAYVCGSDTVGTATNSGEEHRPHTGTHTPRASDEPYACTQHHARRKGGNDTGRHGIGVQFTHRRLLSTERLSERARLSDHASSKSWRAPKD